MLTYNPYQPPSEATDSNVLPATAEIRARIQITPEFIVESLRRHRLQRKHGFAWMCFRLFGAAVFFACAVGGLLISNFFVFAFCLAFGLAAVFPTKIDDLLAAYNMRKSPYNGEDLNIFISDLGYHAVSELQDVTLKWGSFTHWVRFDDGALIYRGPKSFHWLPQSSLIVSSDLNALFLLLESKLDG